MNKVFLIGNLTKDPELTETPNGVAVCRFSIAVNRDYTDADGNREADFFNITVWRGKAENCAKYLEKGKKVCVVGSLQNRSYEDSTGIKRYVTDVVAEDVEFLTPKGNAQPLPGSDKYDKPETSSSKSKNAGRMTEIKDTDLPF